MRKLIFLAILLSISACSSHQVEMRYRSDFEPLSVDSPIVITASSSIPGCEIEKIADVRVERRFYGGSSHAKAKISQMARQLGGNGVLNYNFWIAPSWFSWAAPKATGTVVKGSLDCMMKSATPVK